MITNPQSVVPKRLGIREGTKGDEWVFLVGEIEPILPVQVGVGMGGLNGMGRGDRADGGNGRKNRWN